ncbi:MAG: phage tail protein [Clostridia bacterium]|nr:phage tail protein [Clostridia bacterium]
MADNFGLKIGLDGEKEFKKALADINSQFKVLGSEMQLIESEFGKNSTSVEGLTAKNQLLAKEIESQKSKIETLQSALKNASESFGENDKRTQAWQIQLNNAKAALNNMERELDSNNDALRKAADNLEDAEKEADDFGDEVEDAGEQSEDAGGKFSGLGATCKAVAASLAVAFAAVSAAAVAAGKALVNMTTEGAAYADSVLTESTVTGIATDKLQEYMYAAELVDVSTETLTKSMAKQIKSMKAVQDGTKLSVDAYDKLGVSVLDAEGNLRDGDTVYWEVIDALGKLENETERDALAMQILGKSAQELNPLITAGAERMNELGIQAREAGYVIGDDMLNAYGKLDDEIQYLSVGATAAKNALGTVLLPVLTDLAGEGVDLLGEFSRGIANSNGDIGAMSDVIGDILPKALNSVMKYVPELLEVIGEIVGSLGSAIVDNLPLIVESATQIVFSIVNGLIAALPQIADGALQLVLGLVDGILNQLPLLLTAAVQVVVTLAKGIGKALPKLIPTIVSVVMEVCTTLIKNLPLILDAALQLIVGLAKGILDAIPVLIEALPELINSIIEYFMGAIPQIIDAGIQLITSLVSALPTIIEAIVSVIPQIITGILNAILSAIPLLIDAGIRLITSLIGALPEIIITVVEAIPQIINSIITAVIEAIPLLIQAGFTLITSLIGALPEIITAIVEAIPEIINGIINALLGNIGLLIEAGIQLFMALITNLPTIIIELVKAVPQILSALIGAFGKGIGSFVEIGANLVKGLWEGIKSLASWIWDKVSSWASDLWDGICSFFGIHSPSKKMQWIGDMMMEGLASGIDESAGEAIKSASDMSRDLNSVFDDLSADLTAAVPQNIDVSGVRSQDFSATNAGNPFTIQLSITNFNNYRSEDINELTNEIMQTAGAFMKRKEVVLG